MDNIIKIVDGDILKAKEDIICHQVNCMGAMGSGIAKQIRNKYPEVYKKYSSYCDKHEDSSQMLGITQFIKCHDGKVIANMFGQLHYGTHKQQTDYIALRKCFEYLWMRIEETKESVAIPFNIGCGLAGGSWETVYKIIEEVFGNYDVTLYRWEV